MKDYELTVLFHPDLEMNLDPALDKVRTLIKNNNGKIKQEDLDGKKRLMYSIRNQNFAVYCYFTLELPPEAPAKISNTLNITEEVLRHLLVRADAKKAKSSAKHDDKTTEAKSNEEKGE